MRFIFPLILIFIGIGIYMIYISPMYAKVQVLQAEHKQFNEALDTSDELIALKKELQGKYNRFPLSDLERLETLLPDEVNTVRLVLDVDTAASQYNMQIRNIRVQTLGGNDTQAGPSIATAAGAKSFRSVKVQFTLTTTYANLIPFLADIESSLRIVDVTRVSFATTGGDLNEYTIELETFWLK